VRTARKHEALKKRRQQRLIRVGIPALILVAIAVVAVVITSGGSATPTTHPTRPGVVKIAGPARATPFQAGETIPAFSGTSLWGGRPVAWTGTPGTPTVIAVWAPWCPHCQKELPLMGQISARYPDVRILTVVSAIGAEPGPDPATFLRDKGLSFATAVDDSNGTLMKGLGVTGTPTVYYVGSDGKVRSVTVGEITPSQMALRFKDLSSG
jgi:thiol-disulfide isomerase/thioredoxin